MYELNVCLVKYLRKKVRGLFKIFNRLDEIKYQHLRIYRTVLCGVGSTYFKEVVRQIHVDDADS